MLVNTAADLDAVRTNTAAHYALAQGRTTPLSVSSIPDFAPIPNFTGVFDGQGQTIANLTITPNDSTTSAIGLFGTIGSTGIVRKLNLSNVTVEANPGVGSQWVGTVAGINAGQIIDVSASGQINGRAQANVTAGGLVGQNGVLGANAHPGLITGSSANVAVASDGINVSLGGLVGFNEPGSTIIASYATGNVTSTANIDPNANDCSTNTACQFTSAGGLVGQNFGTIGDVQAAPPSPPASPARAAMSASARTGRAADSQASAAGSSSTHSPPATSLGGRAAAGLTRRANGLRSAGWSASIRA
jgi:The GLUG motif